MLVKRQAPMALINQILVTYLFLNIRLPRCLLAQKFPLALNGFGEVNLESL